MGNKLYLECYSGISGDMMVAALLDLGADQSCLEKALKSLPVEGFSTKISRVSKAGLDACDFAVILEEGLKNHDHDMEYLHGEDHGHGHSHEREHEHSHEHSHADEPSHRHSHDVHAHQHRGLAQIRELIGNADITIRAKKTAEHIFDILAQAEAQAHGVSPEEVHFHEVGAVDSIVDIVAAAVCLDSLGIEEVILPVLYEGCGTVRCQHGILPVPVPAVVNIVSKNGLSMHMTGTKGELVTPTGAAIAAAIKTSDRLPECFSVEKIGMGAGKRNYERPSLLRAMLICEENAKTDIIYKLESNIDDSTGEALGYVMDRLFQAGARDVNYTPVYMKKNRPAWQLNVICDEKDILSLEEIIYEETTTIGIRRHRVERSTLVREAATVNTSLGEARVKICVLPSGKRYYPEYESVANLSRKSKKAYQEVYRIVERECHGKL